MPYYSAVFLVGFLAFAVSAASAQAPQRTTATFDDWSVSCNAVPQPGVQKICELVQVQTIKGEPNPVGQVTISRPSMNGPFKIFFQVPSNVWLQSGIKFGAQANGSPIIAQFRWCLPARCLADADLPNALINNRAPTEVMREDYKDAKQHDVSLPITLKGLAPALSWMQKQ
jgi:invasion protein IalB